MDNVEMTVNVVLEVGLLFSGNHITGVFTSCYGSENYPISPDDVIGILDQLCAEEMGWA